MHLSLHVRVRAARARTHTLSPTHPLTAHVAAPIIESDEISEINEAVAIGAKAVDVEGNGGAGAGHNTWPRLLR